MTVAADQLIARFARSVGKPHEARLYLELFRSEHPERFALIDASGVRGDAARSALATDLVYLQTIGLTPVVVADDLDALLAAAPTLAAERCRDPDGARVACAAGRVAVTDAASHVAEWLGALACRKLVLLDGGLRRADGEVISLVDVTSERHELSADGVLAPGQRERLARACAILDDAAHRLTISMTSPLELLRELFTVRGAGTLLRPGAVIRALAADAHRDAATRAALEELLRSAFGRAVRPAFFDRPIEHLLVTGDDALRGAAIVEPAAPAPYLSKFAVGAAARGEGIGRDLWRELSRHAPRLFWRARPDNPIGDWYRARATGSHRAGPWIIYWRGLEPDELSAAIAFASARPADFESLPP